MKTEDLLYRSLTTSMTYLFVKIVDKVMTNNLPRQITDAMKMGMPQVTGNSGFIETKIDLKIAPMAAAYEWGSGTHRTKGVPGLYPIRAVKAPKLVFWWEKGNKWFIGKELPYGHPGVEPRPYIEPSIKESMPAIKEIVAKEVKATVIIGIKEMFST